MDPCLALLRDLVAIDSVNPSLVKGGAGEAAIARALASHMRGLGLTVHVSDAVPGRPNVVGVLDSGVRGPSLMFCGHTDTVGVHGMTDPFTPIARDGRLYGRGTQDMKAGIAAMLDAARVVAGEGLARGRLVIAAVADEEYASAGADALVTEFRADAAVITEPTDLQIGIAHKGFAWIEVETTGRAAHGSRPMDGRDAILDMGRVLGALERLSGDLGASPAHPLLGVPSLHASIVEGGRELSVYPDQCRLQLERRTLPGEPPDRPHDEVCAILEDLRRADAAFSAAARPMFQRPAYEIGDSPLPRALARAAEGCGLTARTTGMSFWTDAAVLGQAGIPTVLFGPGGAGLHSIEEYVTIADVVACRDTLAALAREWCGSRTA